MASTLTYYKGTSQRPGYFLDELGKEKTPKVGDQIDITSSDRGWEEACIALKLTTKRVGGTDLARIPKTL